MSEPTFPAVQRITARKGSLGEGMEIARILPTKARHMIGAWCFLDHLGPLQFPQGVRVGVDIDPYSFV